ncbi:MAG: substrate-binding domain-containing protein [Chloroflexota bacterium]
MIAADKAAVAKREAKQTQWTGPTSGPTAVPGKRIVYMSGDETNSLAKAYGDYLTAAAKAVGWSVKVIDGKGSPTGWLAGMNQAIGLHPNGIVIFADAASLQDPIKAATAQHIPVVGLHAAATPGATQGLFTNIEEDPKEIGLAEAQYAIADSGGKARAIIVFHGEYAIAQIKAEAMKKGLAPCTGCKLLDYVNFPASEAAQRMPQLVTSWVSRYGPHFYALTVGDNDYDFAVPALSSGGVSKSGVKLIGSDGTPAAYQRIRSGNYQVATVPEPSELQGYQAIDELNRAFHGMPPSGYVAPAYLVTKGNVDAEGGKHNLFIPSNGYKQHYLQIWKTGKTS